MKIDKNTQIGGNRNMNNQLLKTGAKAAGFAFGGPKGAQIAGKVAENPAVQNAVNKGLDAVKNGAQKAASSNAGQGRLKSSLANRSKNLLDLRNKKKQNSGAENPNNNEPSSTSPVEESIEEAKAKIKRKIIIKVILFLAPILLVMMLIITLIAVISYLFPFLMPSFVGEGSGDISITSELFEDTNQLEYYQKLEEKKQDYLASCNRELDVNYIHAPLMYLYYQGDYDDTDYASMKNMLDIVYNLLPASCGEDYAIGGTYYNNLKNSSEFNNYYSVLLKRKTMDTILNEIFDLASELNVNISPASFYIPDDTTVVIDDTGKNPGGNNDITSVSFKDYLLGVVYANVDEKDYTNAEKIKAYTIVYTSNSLAKGSLSVDTQSINLDPDNEMVYCNIERGCSYIVRDNKVYLQIGGGSSGNGNNSFYDGSYYYRRSMDSSVKEELSKYIDEVYGTVLLNKDGKYDYLDASKINSSSVNNYTETLQKLYKEYTVKNLRENNYVDGIDFYNQRIVIPTIAYDQSDYRDVRFCGRTGALSSNNIESSGCGVTSIAIVISSYENSNKYDPPYMSEQARIGHFCGNGIYGTLPGIFWNQAEAFGYSVLNVGKSNSTDLNLVLNHLGSGHMVITNVGPGTFTRGGHYIVLTGTDPVNKKVYVTDPYDRGNKNSVRKSGSGWYDFNLIVREAKSFYIIVGK